MMLEEIIDLTNNNKGFLYLIFRSDNCQYCYGITDIIKDVCLRRDSKFIEINIDKDVNVAKAYSIEHKPTVLVYRDDKLVDSIAGKRNPERYEQNLA